MNSLLLHPRTKAELIAFANDPPQGVLLVGPHGTGKKTIAMTWAGMAGSPELITVLEPDEKGVITIDATRALYQRTRAKQPGRQIVIVDHAETMGVEAQNALLKLLEEPRADVTFVLTAPTHESLLPTILSRLQTVDILPVSAASLSARAAELVDAQTLAQMLFVAAGRPAIFVTLLTDPQAFEKHKLIMLQAKKLLNASPYERLTSVVELCKDRPAAIATLEAMAYMLTQQIRKDPNSAHIATANRLQTCLQRLQNNGNLRAQLTYAFA